MRKFKGHSGKVIAISMNPADDTFLSSSIDGTVRLWNVQQAGCQAELKLPPSGEASGAPLAAFDSTGLVFCVTAAMSNGTGQYVHLYDARNYGAGAFAELKVQQTDLERAIQEAAATANGGNNDLDAVSVNAISRSPFRSLQFNVSGSSILVGADYGVSVVLDGFQGTIQKAFVPPRSSPTVAAVSGFTPDDKTVLNGNVDGTITCWDASSGAVVKRFDDDKGFHLGQPVSCIAANPKYAQFASASSQVALWIWP